MGSSYLILSMIRSTFHTLPVFVPLPIVSHVTATLLARSRVSAAGKFQPAPVPTEAEAMVKLWEASPPVCCCFTDRLTV